VSNFDRKPLLDFTDGQLEQLLGEGMLMDLPPGPLSELRDLVLELALRVREIRRHAKLESTTHDGVQWVRADRIMELLDGG
jgi:hypothetical protein